MKKLILLFGFITPFSTFCMDHGSASQPLPQQNPQTSNNPSSTNNSYKNEFVKIIIQGTGLAISQHLASFIIRLGVSIVYTGGKLTFDTTCWGAKKVWFVFDKEAAQREKQKQRELQFERTLELKQLELELNEKAQQANLSTLERLRKLISGASPETQEQLQPIYDRLLKKSLGVNDDDYFDFLSEESNEQDQISQLKARLNKKPTPASAK